MSTEGQLGANYGTKHHNKSLEIHFLGNTQIMGEKSGNTCFSDIECTCNTKNHITNDRLLIKNYKLHYYKLKMINYKLQIKIYNKCHKLGTKGGRTLHFVSSRLKDLFLKNRWHVALSQRQREIAWLCIMEKWNVWILYNQCDIQKTNCKEINRWTAITSSSQLNKNECLIKLQIVCRISYVFFNLSLIT